jgi:hypothetical protein
MKTCERLAVVALGLALAAPVAGLAGEEAAAPLDGKAAFAQLKTLAGDWEGAVVGQPGEHAVQYRVTSGGNAVIESLFAGTPHEMVSVYFMNGEDLVLTHYCSAANQPRLRLDRAASSAQELRFAFDGGTNFDPAKDAHVHAGRIRLLSAQQLDAEWEFFENGQRGHSGRFLLKRKGSTASLPAAGS